MLKKPVFTLLMIVTATLSLSDRVSAQRKSWVRDEQVRTLLERIVARTDSVRRNISGSLDRSRYDDTRREDSINRAVDEFASSVAQLQLKFIDYWETRNDVEEVLNRGRVLDNLVRNNRAFAAQRDWDTIRSDLATLAGYYSVNWQWDNTYASGPRNNGYGNNPRYGNNSGYGNEPRYGYRQNRFTGTYELDTSRSDNITLAIDRALAGVSGLDRDRQRAALERRMAAPERLAIDQSNRQFTVVSTTAPQVTFEADGRTQEETRPSGRTVRTTTTFNGNSLVVSSLGDRGSDFSVTFEPLNNGNALRVTREIYSDRLTRPVVVHSIYRKTSEVAQLDIFEGRPGNRDYGANAGDDNRPGYESRGRYTIPDNTRMVAVLNTDLSTRSVREGDPFTMTVRSPGEYEGATLEGVVSRVERSGQVTGRASMSLDIRQIRLRGGSTYDFAGYIEEVRTVSGDRVTVDNEGTVKDQGTSQGTRTTTRTGIGAALGAVLGGIIGGGKGAVLGAVLGGGAGAGTVILQGRDDLSLMSGTEFTITAAAPRNASSLR